MCQLSASYCPFDKFHLAIIQFVVVLVIGLSYDLWLFLQSVFKMKSMALMKPLVLWAFSNAIWRISFHVILLYSPGIFDNLSHIILYGMSVVLMLSAWILSSLSCSFNVCEMFCLIDSIRGRNLLFCKALLLSISFLMRELPNFHVFWGGSLVFPMAFRVLFVCVSRNVVCFLHHSLFGVCG